MFKNRLSTWPNLFVALVTLLAVVFLLAPLVILTIQSFTGASYLSFPPPSYSFRWYAHVFQSEEWRNSLVLSLALGIIVTPLSLIIGTMAALGLSRGPLKGRQELYAVLISPMVLPHIVLGLGIFRIALELGISDSFWLSCSFVRLR